MYILYSTCTVTGSQLDISTPPKNESQVSFCCEQFSREKKIKINAQHEPERQMEH